jgi:hypothetical protein
MFNLENQIAAWRKQMMSGGVTNPDLLDELESHLREDIDRQMRTRLSASQAFETAVERIGPANTLKTEFTNAGATPKTLRNLMGFVCAVLIGFILWMSGYTFVALQLSPIEEVIAFAGVAFTLVAACGWRYAIPFLPVLRDKRKRIAVASLCIVFGFVCSNLFCQFVLPPFERNLGGQLPAIGFWAVFPIAVFLGLGCGLDVAARRQVAGLAS